MNNIFQTTSILQKIDEIIGKEISFQDNISRLEDDLIKLNNSSNISSHWLITSHRSGLGKVIILGKKIIRKILKWYIDRIVEQQNRYNMINTRINYSYKVLFETLIEQSDKNAKEVKQLTTAIKSLFDEIEVLKMFKEDILELNESNKLAQQSLNHQIDLIEELKKQHIEIMKHIELIDSTNKFVNSRIRRLERKTINNIDLDEDLISSNKNVLKENVDNIDYFLFENKFRGSIEYIKEIQRRYLDIFKGSQDVLDIGCGRGEFVELLLENGISVKGIDINVDFVEYCLENNLPVERADMFSYLEKSPDNSIGGIFCSQVVEHLTADMMVYFIKMAYKKLKNNAPIVIETINPKNIVAVSNWFYMDLSHVRPVHPDTLAFIAEQEGFNINEIMYTEENLGNHIPPLNIENIGESNLDEFNNKIKFVNEVLSGPQNYSLIAKKMSF